MSVELTDIAIAIRQAKGLRDAAALLLRAGTFLGLERVAVMDDLARAEAPTDEDGNQLSPLLGWTDAFTERWQARGYSLHSPAFLRARVEALPFVSSIHDPKPPELEDWAQRRSIIRELEQIGMPEAIVVPVHQPLARVGIIFWLGQGPAERLNKLVAEEEQQLAMIGLYFFALRSRLMARARLPEDLARLSPREAACMSLIASGCSDEAAAKALSVSPHTVRFHMTNAAEKLGARSRAHATALAVQLGIVEPSD